MTPAGARRQRRDTARPTERRTSKVSDVDVVLVDEAGIPCGVAAKLAAHESPGQPHLAFSVVIARPDGSVLLQRRSVDKYHFRGLWSNSCCSHPRPGEDVEEAARRRVREELGVDLARVRVLRGFWYRAADPHSGLVEHEWDVVVLGNITSPPVPDPGEVSEVGWMSLVDAERLCRDAPEQVTPWLASVLSIASDALVSRAGLDGWPKDSGDPGEPDA